MPVTIALEDLKANEVLSKIAEVSGENVYKCMQCGTCSTVCPMGDEMELTTRAAMLYLQHAQTQPVLESKTPWLCASCHACEVRCPRGINIPRLMEAARLHSLRQNQDRINPREMQPEDIDEMPQVLLVGGFRKLTG